MLQIPFLVQLFNLCITTTHPFFFFSSRVLQDINSSYLTPYVHYTHVFWVSPAQTMYFLIWFMDLKLLSWNVRGLNNKFKRTLMFKYLNYHRPHILFLQETHLTGNKILALRRSRVQQAFHATYSGYARGVAILLNKSLPIRCYILLLIHWADILSCY